MNLVRQIVEFDASGIPTLSDRSGITGKIPAPDLLRDLYLTRWELKERGRSQACVEVVFERILRTSEPRDIILDQVPTLLPPLHTYLNM